jgi:type IV pilus assembly protein PilX
MADNAEGGAMKRQKGFVIIVVFLMLLVLTMIAVGLATRARMTAQMTAATNARSEAWHLANGAQAGFVESQRLMRGESALISNADVYTSSETSGVVNTMTFRVETQCRRARSATAAGIVACRHSELESAVTYGKNNRGSLSVVTGVEQPVLNTSGG